jgi:hypothetical protein
VSRLLKQRDEPSGKGADQWRGGPRLRRHSLAERKPFVWPAVIGGKPGPNDRKLCALPNRQRLARNRKRGVYAQIVLGGTTTCRACTRHKWAMCDLDAIIGRAADRGSWQTQAV